MNTPNIFTYKQWGQYFIDAVRRETNPQYSPKEYTINIYNKQIQNLLNGDINKWLFALALDLVAIKWNEFCHKSPWELFSHTLLFKPFKDIMLLDSSYPFWRFAWLSRYAISDEEVFFFKRWLSKYSLAAQSMKGEDGRRTLLFDSILQLQTAEAKIIARGGPEPPAFLFNWVRVYLL